MTFFRQQLTRIATHILRCNGKLNFSSLFPHFVSNICGIFVGNVILVTAIIHFFLLFHFGKLCFPDETFGPQLLQMCNQALFECLALNLHCLRGDQRALTAVINHRIVCTQFPLSKNKILESCTFWSKKVKFGVLYKFNFIHTHLQEKSVPHRGATECF